MPLPARNTLAVIGAGPIGLEAAAMALDHGFDVHVFEHGEIGSNIRGWGHVQLFTPWRMNVGAAARARLEAAGWQAPPGDEHPSGAEYVARVLEPLAALPELAPRVHRFAQVVHVSRRGMLKGDHGAEPSARRAQPFRLLVRDQGGRESLLHAFALVDASGVFMQPNWAGDGGIPARHEMAQRPYMHYDLPDVLGLARNRFAGRRTLVVGSGASAATTIGALATLADETPGTSAVWVTRDLAALYPERADDPLAVRRALYARARELASGAHPAIAHVGGATIEEFQFNSATHKTRVQLALGDAPRIEEVDEIVVNAGFRPDLALHRELQVRTCEGSEAPMRLAAALADVRGADCLDVPAFGADVLAHPEPDFFVIGHKSYGRNPQFLLETGFRQVADVVARLARELHAGVAG